MIIFKPVCLKLLLQMVILEQLTQEGLRILLKRSPSFPSMTCSSRLDVSGGKDQRTRDACGSSALLSVVLLCV